MQNLEQLLEEALGRSYSLDAGKLLRAKTIVAKGGDRTLVQKDRTFFCSELLAKACKVLGILKNDDISYAKFYPHHFSMKGESFLNLEKGVSIAQGLQIIVGPQEDGRKLKDEGEDATRDRLIQLK